MIWNNSLLFLCLTEDLESSIFTMRSNLPVFHHNTVKMVILSNSPTCKHTTSGYVLQWVGGQCYFSHKFWISLPFIVFSIRYSQMTNTMVHKCSCCQEIKTSKRKVTLTCSDGTLLDHSYTYVEKCSCVGAECITQDNTQQQTQQIKTSQEQANVKN